MRTAFHLTTRSTEPAGSEQHDTNAPVNSAPANSAIDRGLRVRGRISRGYVLALAIIGLLTVCDAWLVSGLLARQELHAAINTVAGAQRMLSQRIAALIGVALESTGPQHNYALVELDRVRNRMAAAHADLAAGPLAPALGTAGLRTAYFAGANPLDSWMSRFLADVGRFHDSALAGGASGAAGTALRNEALGPLLLALNSAVGLHEEAAGEALDAIVGATHLALLLTLLALLAEAVLIFRPLGRHVASLTAELTREATTDPLTGLLNRKALRTGLGATLQRSSSVVAVAIDLDWFKQANEAEGHACGDAILAQVGTRLRKSVRPGDLVGRVGGDEFVAVLQDVADPSVAMDVAERIHTSLHEPMAWDGRAIRLGASIGMATVTDRTTTVDGALRLADEALGRAKRAGRGRIAVADGADKPLMDQEAQIVRLLLDARGGLDWLTVHLQPQVRMSDGKLVGLEALARLTHPELEQVSPEAFLQVAKRIGRLAPVGRQVGTEAMACFAKLRQEGLASPRLALNVSAVELSDSGFVREMEQRLVLAGLSPSDIEIEITEDVLLDRVSTDTRERLVALRSQGSRLALDDFGTGHSGLQHLLALPLDRIKLDRSFIAGIGRDRRADEIVRATMGMAGSLGFDVLAEGVETPAQAAVLLDLGCHLAQGFLYGRPMAAEELRVWLGEREIPPGPVRVAAYTGSEIMLPASASAAETRGDDIKLA